MSKSADDDYNEESTGSGSDIDIDHDDELIGLNDDDESEDVGEYRPDGTHEKLKADYSTFADFEKDLRRYSAATFQTFIKRRTEKLPVGHAQQRSIMYRKIHFACIHHEVYRRLLTRSMTMKTQISRFPHQIHRRNLSLPIRNQFQAQIPRRRSLLVQK